MAAISFYRGVETYLLSKEDVAWGTPSTPAGATDYWDKVTVFNYNITNNFQRIQGIGEGRNATHGVPMGLDVTGSVEWELTDPDCLQYCVIATLSGAGTVGDPYELQEINRIGYESGEMNTLTWEIGSEGATDDVLVFDGVCINNWGITAAVGETVKCTADWVARTVNVSTTAETYVSPTNRPLFFGDGSVTVGSDTAKRLQSFSINGTNNLFIYRSLGSRLIEKPEAGVRRYDFTIVMRCHRDEAGSVLSGVEARALAFSGVTTATTPLDSGDFTAVAISLDLVEGAVAGDRVINIDLENCYIESVGAPIDLEGGAYEITITGFGLSGLTDSTNKVPIRYWTVS